MSPYGIETAANSSAIVQYFDSSDEESAKSKTWYPISLRMKKAMWRRVKNHTSMRNITLGSVVACHLRSAFSG